MEPGRWWRRRGSEWGEEHQKVGGGGQVGLEPSCVISLTGTFSPGTFSPGWCSCSDKPCLGRPPVALITAADKSG